MTSQTGSYRAGAFLCACQGFSHINHAIMAV